MKGLKKHKVSLVVFGLGLVGLALGSTLEKPGLLPPTARMFNLLGWFFIGFGLTLFSFKRNWAVPANVFLLGSMVLALELFCFFSLGMPARPHKVYKEVKHPDGHIQKEIGNLPLANTEIQDVKVLGEGDTAFKVTYEIDQYSRRTTPKVDSAQEYALFFGCSIAFGHGVENFENLPGQYQAVCNGVASYNYAHRGQGTNHMLARLQHHNLREQVREESGKAFYIFFWDHIYRAIGSMERYTDWLYNAPYYKLEDGKLVRDGSFRSGRKAVSWFYEKVFQTSIVRYFEIGFPIELNESHFNLIAEMILESKKAYAEQFGNDEFYMVVHPTFVHYTPEEFEAFLKTVESKGIQVFDYKNVVEYGGKYTLRGDPHPSPTTYKLVAEALCNDVN